MKQKLLVLTTTFPRWKNDPDPPFVYELARRLTANFDVTVHTPHYTGSATKEMMGEIQVHRFRYFFQSCENLAGSTSILATLRRNKLYYGVLPFFLAAQLFSLFILVKKTRPAVIHAHWLFPQGFFAVLLKSFFDIPVVITAHGADVFGLRHPLIKAIHRFTLGRADRIIAVSSALREKINRDIRPVHVDVIPMGVSSEQFSPAKGASCKEKPGFRNQTILYVGRLSEKKGVEYLIDAMPRVRKEFPDADLLIIGSGELEEDLKARAERLGLHESIIFAGPVPNRELPEYYACSSVFVGPSIRAQGGDTEGFGLTFVEAAMSGCFLIGSDVGGIGDIIEDGKTGFLVPEKDSRAIAGKIIYALKNPDEAKQMVARARKKCIEKFEWRVILEKYAKVLLESTA
ncbi:MAG TPA: glycosyltransferase family 4 protein [Proteobacteria bacterium]|nr:glycosyltransferase family 4 protein [Pseudomonadota bacterium]